MLIGKVTGNIAATIKHPVYKGQRLLNVAILTPEQQPTGVGDLVLITQEGRSAMAVVGQTEVPVRTVIVAIIDHIDLASST